MSDRNTSQSTRDDNDRDVECTCEVAGAHPCSVHSRERPILFSGPMVRALLDGRKTQTRRVVNPQPATSSDGRACGPIRCPYGAPGDTLWVRETWCSYMPGSVRYRADGHNDAGWTWRPSIFMPRWASRLTLRVYGVRVERVQQITQADARAEGVVDTSGAWGDLTDTDRAGPRGAFEALWNSINAERGFGWDVNPWVWVVSFELEKGARHAA